MADGEPQAKGVRLGPHGKRLYQRSLLAMFAAVPALAALYGLHRDGGEGAGVGLVAAIWVMAMLMLPAIKLMNWLSAPTKPPLWRHERLYWSLTAGIAAVIFIGVIILIGAFDPVEEHGIDGYIDGVIAGVVAAALFGFVAARFHAWLMWLKGPQPVDREAYPSTLQEVLAPTLTELEAVRFDVGRRIRRRASWMTPLGVVVLLTAWAIFAVVAHEFDLLLPIAAFLIGAAAGHVVASWRLAGEYERLYQARVLPRLAALFGALTFQRPPAPDLKQLRDFHVFRHFDSARADDAIAGEHRGLKLSIVQLDLTRGWGLWRKRVFHGLLIGIELKQRLLGVTAIAADAGGFGNLRDELARRNIRRVGLESRAFEREYEVYATDQVMARALITPDFMERFMALGKTEGFGRPLALAQDNLLQIAMPRLEQHGVVHDFFAPPTFEDPASDDGVLDRLYHDIQAVLSAADAAIALDAPTDAQAKSSRRQSRAAKAEPDNEDPIGEDQ